MIAVWGLALVPGALAADDGANVCFAEGEHVLFRTKLGLANPAHEHTSVGEAFFFNAWPPLQGLGAPSILAEPVRDSRVLDLRCPIQTATWTSGSDGGDADLQSYLIRWYGAETTVLDATPCAKGHSGAVPPGARYAAVVGCTGVPYDLDGVFPVAMTVDFELAP